MWTAEVSGDLSIRGRSAPVKSPVVPQPPSQGGEQSILREEGPAALTVEREEGAGRSSDDGVKDVEGQGDACRWSNGR